LSEAFRRAVLRLFVRRGFFDEDQAQTVSEDDRPFPLRLARC